MSRVSFPLLVFFLFSDVITNVVSEKRYVIRTTSKGRVGGYTEKVLNKNVSVFLGVPYAEAPVGNLRFKAPVPYHKWEHVLNATNHPASCFQAIDTGFDRFAGVEMWNPNTAMSEDCLYLNVWEPGPSNSSKRAVMVWIYGGGLSAGTSTLDVYDGRVLAAVGDVVVVSMQYRIGALGFLYLGTPDAPGNQGLLDQNLALRWVRENIAHFGGDPDRVTVFGESAGAFSANLHLISPLSRDLVRSGIMQSASAAVPWGIDMPDVAKAKAKRLAKLVGCTRKKEHDTVKCLQQIKATDFIDAQEKSGDPNDAIPTEYVATIDNHFLTEHPVATLNKGNFKQESILLGVNRDEGYYFLAYQHPDYLGRNITKEITPDAYRSMVKAILELPPDGASVVAEAVAFEYGAPYHGKSSTDYRKPLDDVMGDTAFKCPVVDVALYYSKDPKVSVYLYEFNHRTSVNPWPSWMGAMHGYEIDHVFGLPITLSGYRQEEADLSRMMVSYWTNFAKTGNPNRNENVDMSFKWPKFKSDDRRFLVFESREIRVDQGLRDRQCEFWRDLIPKIRKATHEDGKYSTGDAISFKQYQPSTFFNVFAVLSALLITVGV